MEDDEMDFDQSTSANTVQRTGLLVLLLASLVICVGAVLATYLK